MSGLISIYEQAFKAHEGGGLGKFASSVKPASPEERMRVQPSHLFICVTAANVRQQKMNKEVIYDTAVKEREVNLFVS